MSERPDLRRFERAPFSLEVRYRTRGSFLVSYSRNLSKGGLFLETTELLPVGSQLTVRFAIPGVATAIETVARVMWVRQEVTAEGFPTGLGLQFDSLEQSIGAAIDRLVQDFAGMNLLALASDNAAIDRLTRYLGSILTCEVMTARVPDALASGFGAKVDLILLDLDSAGDDGLRALQLARSEVSQPIPVVALSRSPELRARAQAAGASAVLENPPPYEHLREQVLEVLGKPYRAS